MNSPFARLVVRWLVLALGVVMATRLVPGIHCSDVGALVAVVVLLSFFNAILRPILVLFTLPFIIVTMGLGIVVINAILFLFVGRIVDGFTVAGFWPAVGGSLVVSATNFVVSAVVRTSGARGGGPPPRPPAPGPDVIDI
ncbi:MAG TPA: phage holin family protein [Opitutaceae bacterium]|nr:phage holin family protein [Opitutaceae bacterium]